MQYPKFLWFITLSYSMLTILMNWFSPYSIHVLGLEINAVILITPFLFTIVAVIAEVYGYKFARCAFWYGFLFNTILLIFEHIIIYLPSPEYATTNVLFDTLLDTKFKPVLALFSSYFISQPLNAFLIAKSKIVFKGQYIFLRFMFSGLIATGIGSFIFSAIAFGKMFGNPHLSTLIWLIMTVTVFGSFLLARVARKLKYSEKLDIYDRRTDFNLLSLNISYFKSENEFKERSENEPYIQLPTH